MLMVAFNIHYPQLKSHGTACKRWCYTLVDQWDKILSGDWIYLQWMSCIFKGSFKASKSSCTRNLQTAWRSTKGDLLPRDHKHVKEGVSTTYQPFSIFMTFQSWVCMHKFAYWFLFSFFPIDQDSVSVIARACPSLQQPLTIHSDHLSWALKSEGFVLYLHWDGRIHFKPRTLRKWKERAWKYLDVSNHKSLRKTPPWSIDLS